MRHSCSSVFVMSLRQENQGRMVPRWEQLREGFPRQEACHAHPLDVVVTAKDSGALQPCPFVFQP